jgi:Putative peptidoglycan binding domain
MVKILMVFLLLIAGNGARAFILDEELFAPPTDDVLAPRDDYGVMHQGKNVIANDFDPRHTFRWEYYFEGPEELIRKPAYVAAMQRDLRRLGYYCGPIDGIYSPKVSDAIARLQKNYSMRVTGTPTESVRRALHLP